MYTGPHRRTNQFWNTFTQQYTELKENINKLEELQAQAVKRNEIERLENLARTSQDFPTFLIKMGQSVNVLNKNKGLVNYKRTMGLPFNIYTRAKGIMKPEVMEKNVITENGRTLKGWHMIE